VTTNGRKSKILRWRTVSVSARKNRDVWFRELPISLVREIRWTCELIPDMAHSVVHHSL
jgi:hypothetical protein